MYLSKFTHQFTRNLWRELTIELQSHSDSVNSWAFISPSMMPWSMELRHMYPLSRRCMGMYFGAWSSGICTLPPGDVCDVLYRYDRTAIDGTLHTVQGPSHTLKSWEIMSSPALSWLISPPSSETRPASQTSAAIVVHAFRLSDVSGGGQGFRLSATFSERLRH